MSVMIMMSLWILSSWKFYATASDSTNFRYLLLEHDHLTHVDHLQHCLLLREPLHYLPLCYTLPSFALDRASQQLTNMLYLEPQSKILIYIVLEEHRDPFWAQITFYLPWQIYYHVQ